MGLEGEDLGFRWGCFWGRHFWWEVGRAIEVESKGMDVMMEVLYDSAGVRAVIGE